ncbi:MAG TPA: M20/M25/M40 family metallo-hydrolase [Myxococcales bacterium]|nr:M20/M25/M40 family metallo-hydrolase [Myxococcales bacterium]
MPLLAAALLAASSAAAGAHRHYEVHEATRLVPLLTEVLRFDTVAGHDRAHAAQKQWLRRVGEELGFVVREAGPVTEVELPGPAGAPVLGLVIHGDVQPVEEKGWSAPPFAGVVRDGWVIGRGAADDKGPLVQALLAMRSLAQAVPRRTHTVRLLVGSDEESGSTDFATYLAAHKAPDYSLVLDSGFPVVVGEKAWDALAVSAPPEPSPRPGAARFPFVVESLEGGLAPSIVPDRARLVLRWRDGPAAWTDLLARLRARTPDQGTRLEAEEQGPVLALTVHGRAAHGGVNLAGGRNAIVSLARLVDGELPSCSAADLLAFALLAGKDLWGTGLGLVEETPLWGRYDVNVATISTGSTFAAAGHEKDLTLVVNLRRPPPLTGPQLRARLEDQVRAFGERTGARLATGGFWRDEPFGVPPDAKLVRRLLRDYERASGRKDPLAISGGGTYAKRIPNAVAFGMWFPGEPYPGHDTDEKVRLVDLHRGAHVLIEALADLATHGKIDGPFSSPRTTR